jgi:hypothetical protein
MNEDDYNKILDKANKLPLQNKRDDTVKEYLEIIKVLRSKNYTWKQVADFLANEGLTFHQSYLCTQYKKLTK